ncbi:MAG: 16S rRNA (cytidine(1402)-2'-O)-methyltransferase [Candidatus Portnoybacteria bacterium]|nr:16S rRNA (cytidine(1402)-2'-O)-methyltransferase [Candidatus Portnoybacteria bacterium]
MFNLYVIATPIGNLEDFSLRGLRILKEVDLILCEDTRTTKKLLTRYQISKATISYHQHSRLTKIRYILEQLKRGKDLALVSEAGTPGISDPGVKLIDYLVKQMPDLKIIPIPGPSALITALSIAGLSADKFIFLGFPPTKKKRKKFFQEIVQAKYTVVFYESPHRIVKTLIQLNGVLTKVRKIVVCRELTKKFETIYRGQIEQVIEQITKDKIKGEFVVIVEKK